MNRCGRIWAAFVALIAVAAITASAWAQSGGKAKESAEATAKDIVDTAVAAGKFGTLVTAIKAAEMVEALKGEGPFTVFAPTDGGDAASGVGAETSSASVVLAAQLSTQRRITYWLVPTAALR